MRDTVTESVITSVGFFILGVILTLLGLHLYAWINNAQVCFTPNDVEVVQK